MEKHARWQFCVTIMTKRQCNCFLHSIDPVAILNPCGLWTLNVGPESLGPCPPCVQESWALTAALCLWLACRVRAEGRMNMDPLLLHTHNHNCFSVGLSQATPPSLCSINMASVQLIMRAPSHIMMTTSPQTILILRQQTHYSAGAGKINK